MAADDLDDDYLDEDDIDAFWGGTNWLHRASENSSPPFDTPELARCESDLRKVWESSGGKDLWRLLVLSGLSSRQSTHWWELPALLRRHHQVGQPGGATTAFLLRTHERWASSALRYGLPEVVDRGLLGPEELDELAYWCFWPDRPVYEYPARWLGAPFDALIVVDTSPDVKPLAAPLHIDPAQIRPVEAHRSLAPPARRWAAARLLTRHLSGLTDVKARVVALRQSTIFRAPDHAAAVLQGWLDALDSDGVADEDQQCELLALCTRWPKSQVRIEALERMAGLGQADERKALKLARQDTDASVRRWVQRRAAASRSSHRAAQQQLEHDGGDSSGATSYRDQ